MNIDVFAERGRNKRKIPTGINSGIQWWFEPKTFINTSETLLPLNHLDP